MRFPWTSAIERRVQAGIETAKQEGVQQAKAEIASAMVRALRDPRGNQSAYQLNPQVPTSYPQVGGSPYPLYGYDRPLWYGTPNSPRRRPDSLITVDTIRQFADSYDVMRACINHLKREVVGQRISLGPKDAKDDSDSTRTRVEEAETFFTRRGGLGEKNETRRHYELKILEDVLVVGAFASWNNRARGGNLLQVLPIDAATIRPRMDAYGWPGPNEEWYEQWIMGMKITGFVPEDLTYDGIWPMSYSPWFRSPVEYLISTTLSALKSDEWNRTWLTDGNTPSDMIATPPEWTPDQVIQYAEWFNAMLAGQTKNRQGTKFVPGGLTGVSKLGRKDQDFAEFDLWLLRRTCAIYGVQPASIGFVGEQYKVTQDKSMEATSQFGAGALLELRKEHYDYLLEELGYGDLEVLDPTKEEDAKTRAERLFIACGVPWMKVNEARKADGLEAETDGDVLLVPNTVRPLEQAIAEPEPVDPGAQNGNPNDAEKDDLNRWMRKALGRLKMGRTAACGFQSDAIGVARAETISDQLKRATTEQEVRSIFENLLVSA